jgi:hypothetical protein
MLLTNLGTLRVKDAKMALEMSLKNQMFLKNLGTLRVKDVKISLEMSLKNQMIHSSKLRVKDAKIGFLKIKNRLMAVNLL